MREIIQIHVGECGSRMGNAAWELFCKEHAISTNGTMPGSPSFLECGDPHLLFDEVNSRSIGSSKYVPRAIFADLDPDSIDALRVGENRDLFRPKSLLTNKSESSNVYSAGSNCSTVFIDSILDEIRRSAESATNIDGFLIHHSISGGTGSGLVSRILGYLHTNFSKKVACTASVFPSPNFSHISVEPYNAVCATSDLINEVDATIILDNQALYDIAGRQMDIEQPSFKHINGLIAKILSDFTISMRHHGTLNTTLSDFVTNMIPYPRMHFLNASFAPCLPTESSCPEKFTTNQITDAVFAMDNMYNSLTKHNRGKYMACSMMYRGDVGLKDAINAVQSIRQKKSVKFVDWCPTGFKVGINSQLPKLIHNTDKTCSLIANTTAAVDSIRVISRKSDILQSKMAFFFYLQGGGMRYREFNERRDDLGFLEKDYELANQESNQQDVPSNQDNQ